MFKVPKSKGATKAGQFEFQVEGDPKTYAFPKMQYITGALAKKLLPLVAMAKKIETAQKKGKAFIPTGLEQEQMIAGVEAIFETYAPGLFAALDQEQLNVIVEAWGRESSIGLGESSSSAS